MKLDTRIEFFFVVFALILACFSYNATAEDSVGVISNIIGTVQIQRSGKSLPATKDFPIYISDIVTTKEKSASKISFMDGSTHTLFQNTEFKINEYKFTTKNTGNQQESSLELLNGKVKSFIKPQENGNVNTKIKVGNSVMGVRGTEVVEEFINGTSKITALTGDIIVEVKIGNVTQKFLIQNSQQITSPPGKSPTITKLTEEQFKELNSSLKKENPFIQSTEKKESTSSTSTEKKGLNGKTIITNPDGTNTLTLTYNRGPNPTTTTEELNNIQKLLDKNDEVQKAIVQLLIQIINEQDPNAEITVHAQFKN